MRLHLSFSIGVLCMSASALCIASEAAHVIGEAYSLDNQKLLYTEQHLWTSPEQRLVRYIAPNGELIAKKQVDYHRSRLSPNIEQLNELAGELIRITRLDDGKTQIDYQETSKSRVKTEILRTPQQQVVDAGFDEYVLAHWETLLTGEKHNMAFVAPSRQTHVNFAIKKVTCDTAKSSDKQALVCFQIKPSSFLYRLALDPITLTYQRISRRLQRFVGMGNIADQSGDYLNVDIRYRYQHVAEHQNTEQQNIKHHATERQNAVNQTTVHPMTMMKSRTNSPNALIPENKDAD